MHKTQAANRKPIHIRSPIAAKSTMAHFIDLTLVLGIGFGFRQAQPPAGFDRLNHRPYSSSVNTHSSTSSPGTYQSRSGARRKPSDS